MEVQGKVIRKAFKQLSQEGNYDDNINMRLLSLSHMVSRVSNISISIVWINNLLAECNNFIIKIQQNTYFRHQINEDLPKIEKKILGSLTTDLGCPADQFESFYNQALSQIGFNCSLDYLYPKFLAIILRFTNFTSNEVYQGDADNHFKKLFESQGIPFNSFVKNLAIKVLCNRNSIVYSLNKLEDFLFLFFGSYDNFKFYVKAAKCLNILNDLPNIPYFSYKIVMSAFNRDYKGTSIVTKKYDIFECRGLASYKEDCRNDGILLFGRHPCADIVFPPDDYSVDLLSCIIIGGNDDIFMLDTSKRSYCSFKLEHKKKYKLEVGQMINLARKFTLLVENINSSDSNEMSNYSGTKTYNFDFNETPQISTVEMQHVEGLFEKQKFKVTTKMRNPSEKKTNHIFGTGCGGIAPDVFFPSGYGVSKHHFSLDFEEENLSWTITDYNSTNGTFLLIKNNEQLKFKKPSSLKKVFNLDPEVIKKKIIDEDICTIFSVGNYTFSAQIIRN